MSYSNSKSFTKSLAELSSRPVESKNEVAKSKTDFAYPKFTPVGKDLTAAELVLKLTQVHKINNKGVSKPIVTAVPSLRIPDQKCNWKYSWKAQMHPADAQMYSRLRIAGLNRYAKPTESMVRSNGTKRGLFNRMAKQIVVPYVLPQMKDVGQRVKRILTIRDIPDDVLSLKLTKEHPAFEHINTKACAGLPYAFYPQDNSVLPKVSDQTNLRLIYNSVDGYYIDDKGDKIVVKPGDPIPLGKPMWITDHALHWAKNFCKHVDDCPSTSLLESYVGNFFAAYPDLGVFMLKRKDEKGERINFPPDLNNIVEAEQAKVRPYGCQPLAMRLFGMYAGYFVEHYMNNFMEDVNSISAYHFSQFYGGAQRVFNYLDYHYQRKEKSFIGLAYGDDQLWMIKLREGKVIYLTPDVSAMDMNSRSSTIIAFYKWVVTCVPNLPEEVGKRLVAHLMNAFIHRIHIDGSGIVQKTESLFSGVSLTTVINIFNSARIQMIMEEEIDRKVREVGELKEEEVMSVIAKGMQNVKDQLGYTFKGLEGLSLEVANMAHKDLLKKHESVLYVANFTDKEKVGIPLPFLSNKIIIYNGKPMCAPYDPWKFGASLVLPSANGTKGLGIRINQNERCMGVYFSGGWMDHELSKVLRETIEENNKVIGKDFGISEIGAGNEDDIMEVFTLLKMRTLPSVEFMADMNLLDKADFAAKYLGDKPVTEEVVSSSKNEVGASNPYIGVLSELDDFDDLSANKAKVDEINPGKLGHYNALTLKEEVEKKLRLVKEYEKRALRRFVEFSVKSSKRGGYMKVIEEDDYDRNTLLAQFEEDLDEFADDSDAAFDSLIKDVNENYSKWESWNEEHGVEEEIQRVEKAEDFVFEDDQYDEDEDDDDVPPPVPEFNVDKLSKRYNLDAFEYGTGRGGFN